MTLSAAEKNDFSSLTITRSFDAPRDQIFKAWTKSRHLINWWGPEGFSMPYHKMDIHPGGIYRCDLRGPDGSDHWMQGVYREMVEPSHLAFTHSWNEDGKMSPETLIAIELTENNGKTDMVFYQSGFENESERDSHENGWSESFDRLEAYLQSEKSEF